MERVECIIKKFVDILNDILRREQSKQKSHRSKKVDCAADPFFLSRRGQLKQVHSLYCLTHFGPRDASMHDAYKNVYWSR